MRRATAPKKIRETQLSQPGGMMQVRNTLERVRVLEAGEDVPDGAEIVASDTPEYDWKEVK